MNERTEPNPLGDPAVPLMRPSVASAVREMRSRAPMMAANGIFHHPPQCTQEEENFIADCLKKNIPIYVIAGMIHCEKRFLSRYIRNHPDLLELKEEQGENILDEAEYQLDRLNRAGNASTIIFTLQTKGRKRGWTTEDVGGEGDGGSGSERIVMGLIPDEEVKKADEEIKAVRGTDAVNPGGVMTDPVTLAAMEQLKKGIDEKVEEAVQAAMPEAIDAESVEVGGAPYDGDGFMQMPAGDDPWAEGANSPFYQ